jgi:hypothetical protein
LSAVAQPVSSFAARDVRKSFGKLVVLDGLTLEVPQGCVLGLLGENGAGNRGGRTVLAAPPAVSSRARALARTVAAALVPAHRLRRMHGDPVPLLAQLVHLGHSLPIAHGCDMSTQRLVQVAAVWSVSLAATSLARAEVFDFESAPLDSLPPGWSTAMTHEGGEPRWAVVRAEEGGQALAQLSTDRTSQRFPLAMLTTQSLRDGAIKVRFKPISGRVDQAAGLVWRYRDENNYYVVRANALEDNVVLYKVEDGDRVAISPVGQQGEYGQKHDVPAGEWHELGVRFLGNKFTVSFDGTKLYDVEDSTFADAGRVGLWTKADSVTQFDDFDASAGE